MASHFRMYLSGFALLAWLNLKHYFFAVWGFRLRLDPDYPAESRFRGDLIVDSVLEYRIYGLFAPWCAFLAFVLPYGLAGLLAGVWTFQTWKRTYFYSSPFRFWTQAYREAPTKPRNQIRYAEEIGREIERRDKAGAAWDSAEMQELISAGMILQEKIIRGKH